MVAGESFADRACWKWGVCRDCNPDTICAYYEFRFSDRYRRPCPSEWDEILEAEARQSEQNDRDFEEDHYELIEAGSIQL